MYRGFHYSSIFWRLSFLKIRKNDTIGMNGSSGDEIWTTLCLSVMAVEVASSFFLLLSSAYQIIFYSSANSSLP